MSISHWGDMSVNHGRDVPVLMGMSVSHLTSEKLERVTNHEQKAFFMFDNFVLVVLHENMLV